MASPVGQAVRQGVGWAVAIPAVAGVVAGTAVQQRISERAVAGAFVVRALELSFAAVQLMFAWQLAKKAGLR
jgi:L-amino acid N-acyltransferase YncA